MPLARRVRPLALVLLCLSVLLPLFLPAPGAASPAIQPGAVATPAPVPEETTWQASGDLVAFLRQGNLWLMQADGADPRQVTAFPEGVTHHAWSPSGRYILLQHGGRFWHYTMHGSGDPPEARLALYDVETGELRDLAAVPATGYNVRGRFPAWAQDADELLMEVIGEAGDPYPFSVVRLGLDGAYTPVTGYSQQQACGGPDGPMTITNDLLWNQELGSPFARVAYRGIVWWADRDVAFVNTGCGNGISLDLTTGEMTEYPRTVWLDAGPDGRIVAQDFALVGGQAAWLVDPATGATSPIDAGDVFALGPSGEIVSTTIARGPESAFTSDLDDTPGAYTDNTVTVWLVDGQGGNRRQVTTLDMQGTGVPSVGAGGVVIVGTVDNPTAMMGVDQSPYTAYGPEIFAEHQKVLRIDAETGEVTVLATNAYRPRLQPTGGTPASQVPEPPGQAAEQPAEPEPQPTEAASERGEPATEPAGSGIAPGGGWIAYTGEDGNIWRMQPDGSARTQVTTDGRMDNGLPTYDMPAWSHDGSMLAFIGHSHAGASAGVWVLRDDTLTLLPNTSPCFGPAFSADNQRVLYTCSQSVALGDPVPEDLTTNPLRGFVSSSALDGSDQRVEIPYTTDGSGVEWTSDGKAAHNGRAVDVRPSDGMIVVVYGGFHKAGVHRFSADGAHLGSFELYGDGSTALGPYDARLTPDGEHLIATVCTIGCLPVSDSAVHDVVMLNLDGNVVAQWTHSYPGQVSAGVDISPDGTRVVAAFGVSQVSDPSIMVFDAPGTPTTIGGGTHPAWQPEPGVAPTVPAGAQDAAPASDTAATVPDALIGAWSGIGYQSNPEVDWPITITVTGGGVGAVIGTTDYPEDGCGGDLVLREVTPTGIVATERLTRGQDFCADGGTITLALADGASVAFAWEGIGSNGTPSSASGTLSRSDSAGTARDAAAPAAAPSGPVVDTTRLDPYYIGTFSGIGEQTDPDNEWPVTVTFTGGGPGDVIGTVEYPSLGCGGELILDSINPNDEWRGFRATERITYGHDSCIDGGTFAFSTAESGIGITFGWTSPVSDTRAFGHLPKVEPGMAPSQAETASEAPHAPASTDAPVDEGEPEPASIEPEG